MFVDQITLGGGSPCMHPLPGEKKGRGKYPAPPPPQRRERNKLNIYIKDVYYMKKLLKLYSVEFNLI